MKKILEKLKEIKKSISYYENGNKRKEKIKVIEKEKLFEISEKNNVSKERQSFNILNQDNQKEDEDNECTTKYRKGTNWSKTIPENLRPKF